MDYFNYYNNYNYYTTRENLPWILDFTNKSIQYNLNNAINIAKDSIEDENQDATMYETLITLAPSEEAKDIIASIRDDEKIHSKLLREIFTKITGVILPVHMEISNYPKLTYLDGIKQALMGELKAVEKYRELLVYMPTKELYNKVLYIMTDEMKHATKYNYLITMFLTNNN